MIACLFFQTRSILIQIDLIFTVLHSQLPKATDTQKAPLCSALLWSLYAAIALTALGTFSVLWLLPKDCNLSTESWEHYSGSGIPHKYPSVECASYIDLSVEQIAFYLAPLLKPYHTISMGSSVLLAM